MRDLRSGAVRAASVSVDDRRLCVDFLWAEGYSAAESAELLGVHERTLQRDRAAIKACNAITPDPDFTAQLAGNLLRRAEASSAKLRRMARDKETPHAARIEAEAKSFEVEVNAFACLQRAGLLPTLAQTSAAQANALATSIGPELADLAGEAQRLRELIGADPQHPAITILDGVMRATEVLQLAAQLELARGIIASSATGTPA